MKRQQQRENNAVWITFIFQMFNEKLLYEQRANVHEGYDGITYYVDDSYANLDRFYRGF